MRRNVRGNLAHQLINELRYLPDMLLISC
jgi:hypothetical protein